MANRWVYTLDAVLAGAGVGLFIDEVGKFVTQNNNYFTPWAAPIIYAFFLLTVILYLQVSRPPLRGPRAELYRAFDSLEEVLEHDLDRQELARIVTETNPREVLVSMPSALAIVDQKVRGAYSPIVIAGVIRVADFILLSLNGSALYRWYLVPLDGFRWELITACPMRSQRGSS